MQAVMKLSTHVMRLNEALVFVFLKEKGWLNLGVVVYSSEVPSQEACQGNCCLQICSQIS
jgi:hypothetical protein